MASRQIDFWFTMGSTYTYLTVTGFLRSPTQPEPCSDGDSFIY
jgi:2-hydroxychromene-2-carboxylate isomerase